MIQVVQVSGQSMDPYLKTGDWVLISKDNFSLSLGDLVFLKRNNRLVVHRYIGNGSFKGDRTKSIDNEIDQKLSVIGRITHRKTCESEDWIKLRQKSLFKSSLARLSKLNIYPSGIRHIFIVALVYLNSLLLKKLENYDRK